MRNCSRKMIIMPLCVVAVVTFTAFTGCRENVRPQFDATQALVLIEKQVGFGPRVPGSGAWRECRSYLTEYFDSLGYEVTAQDFTHLDYRTRQSIQMTNLTMRKNGSANDGSARILLAAHWDSRPRCDRDPDPARRDDSLPGAVDGAAGVALLMELARMFSESPPNSPIEFALFDGEDWGVEGDVNQYLLGSTEFARRVSGSDYRFAIIADIFAHRGASLAREGFSQRAAAEVNDRIWRAARELGVSRFVDSVSREVLDDHLPLLNVGINAVTIIDLDYPYWHTSQDTPDKCDSSALADVGRVIAHAIYEIE
ncbi:MAG: M28 family peptidase [Candidatus Zixiibacteriota bacterium]